MISNCGHDENNKYRGGAAGDQSGTEWALINWYNRPWKCVLRHPDAKVRAMLATGAARNNKIGYDQNQRGTYWVQLKANNYDPIKITVACEADCSSGVAANVKAAGYRLGIDLLKNVNSGCTTSNLRATLKAAGFEVLTEGKYLTSDAYLLEGDILLNDGVHTATNVTNGAKSATVEQAASSGETVTTKIDAAQSKDRALSGIYTVTASDFLALRAGAGTGKILLAKMPNGAKAQCYGFYTSISGVKWLYVVYNGMAGFASSEYLRR